MDRWIPNTLAAVTGMGVGGFLSVIPLELMVLLAAPLYLAPVLTLGRGESKLYFQLGFFCSMLGACALPFSAIDHDIGPLDYRDMTVRAMTRDLKQTWNVRVTRFPLTNDTEDAAEPRYDFRTTEPQPWREVVQRLADETGHRLSVDICANGSTILRGPDYYTARLEPAEEHAIGRRPKMEGSGSTPESDLRVSPDPEG